MCFIIANRKREFGLDKQGFAGALLKFYFYFIDDLRLMTQ